MFVNDSEIYLKLKNLCLMSKVQSHATCAKQHPTYIKDTPSCQEGY
jgi:hypothetical protein